MDDLVKQINDKASKGDEEDKRTIDSLRETIKNKDNEFSEKLKKMNDEHSTRLADFELKKTLSLYEGRFDIKGEDDHVKRLEAQHMEFIKYQFGQKYKLVPGENGTPVVHDHEGNIVRDDNLHEPLSVSAVLDQLVSSSAIPLKESRKVDGRGGNGGNGSQDDKKTFFGNVNMAKINTWEEFLSTEQGKTLEPNSKEMIDAYGKFKEAHEN
jgi:hypothetical protein